MSSKSNEARTLNIISDLFIDMRLHIDDVELLRNAFAVQALVAPLVRLSNKGRYEPYVAKRWRQRNNSWIFELRPDLTCEDGQRITAPTFRESLIRSLRRFSRDDLTETPFKHLLGIEELFSSNSDLELGIAATGDQLTFSFSKTVGQVFLEYLAMTPFAFICGANFDGSKWKSKETFVPSGPYKTKAVDLEADRITLELRNDWQLNSRNGFATVALSRAKTHAPSSDASITMTYAHRKSAVVVESMYEFPRALLSLRLGIEHGRFFADQSNRRVLKSAVTEVLDNTECPFENYHRSESFFFSQVTGHEVDQKDELSALAPKHELLIRARSAGVSADVDFYQGILISALEKLRWPFRLDFTPIQTINGYYKTSYDITFDRSHVAATLDPEFLRMLFKSNLGPRYQDPGSRVSALIDQFELGRLTYRDFLINFNAIISAEAAVIPMFHRGLTWLFEGNIDTRGISPHVDVLKFDELLPKA